jgi:allophanate hydrolase
VSAEERVAGALARIAAADRPDVWIHRRDDASVLAEAREVDRRVRGGEALPLAGVTVAVKDNIDVAGSPTTAGCPAFSYLPEIDAVAVQRLRAAGALVLGKTNMDQFATGLVGTRSPYGAVRDARDPDRVAGGSSSGSAVAVALGLCDLALGTDTAGSGRVPAAFQGIVGAKPTRGLVPAAGVVPACRSFDCVTVFAPGVESAQAGIEAMAGTDRRDPLGRELPASAPSAAPAAVRVAIAPPGALAALSDQAMDAYRAVVARLPGCGIEVGEIDLEPFLAAGDLLYSGAFVSERYAAVGAFVADHPDDVDPIVAKIILAAAAIPAAAYVADTERLDFLRAAATELLAGFDALLLPTAPFQPTLAEVAAEPIELNRRLGIYTSFGNLLDLCAYSVPAGEADGGCFGITLYGPAFHDRLIADLARRLQASCDQVGLFVVGAHMTGGPLNHELSARGGRFLRDASTARSYQLFRLETEPPKPGLVRLAEGEDGCSITGELWTMPPTGLAALLAALPTPMALGRVRLLDGSNVVGFLCEPAALADAEEISRFGGWRAYQAAGETALRSPSRSSRG